MFGPAITDAIGTIQSVLTIIIAIAIVGIVPATLFISRGRK